MSMTRQQITLLGIFALFLAPVLLVVMMRSSWWQYQPEKFKNRGQLVQPPVQLPVGPVHADSADKNSDKITNTAKKLGNQYVIFELAGCQLFKIGRTIPNLFT